MGISEKVKKALRRFIVSPFFLIVAALIVFSLGTLFGLGYLRYYVDGDSINRRAIHSTLLLKLWESPEFLPGELNLLKGNQEATLSEDGKTMILTRSFSEGNTDLFVSHKTDKGWSKPVALSGFINTRGYDERGPCLSRDGNWLLFQSNRINSYGGYDLYMSQKIGDRWSEPVNLGENINTKYDETYASFGPYGASVFFSSNRPKSMEAIVKGERNAETPTTTDGENGEAEAEVEASDWDIYYSTMVIAGNPAEETLPIYGEPFYLDYINTEWNEWQVSVPSNGDQLFFSSDREEGLGGYDIWMSRFFQGTYIEPENLGKPVNSHMDETFPTFANRGTEMVFVSNVYSIHPRALKYYGTSAKEVLSRFDYKLLRNVILVILLLVLAGVAIHYLLKLLLDSELKLLQRCLLASFLLHLLLAALTGSMFLTSKIEETVSTNLQEMTVNMNALAQESISVAIRESVASLPTVQAPQTMEQKQVEVPLQTETPIETPINPYPDTVAVKQTAVASEKFTKVHQAEAKIRTTSKSSKIANLNFTNTNIMMESLEGIVQSGEGDNMDPNEGDREPPPPQDTTTKRIAENRPMATQSFDPMEALKSEVSDAVTENVQSHSIATASRTVISGEVSNMIKRGVDSPVSTRDTLEISSSSPTSVGFEQSYGSLSFDAHFVMEVVEEDEEEEEEDLFIDFRGAAGKRIAYSGRFGHDNTFTPNQFSAPNPIVAELYEIERAKKVKKVKTSSSLGRVGDLLKQSVPTLTLEEDSELEIPEYMLEDEEKEEIRPVF